MKRFFLCLVLGLALCLASARAQVAFTITGTANTTDFGYTQGNSYTFTYVTTAGLANNSDNYFDSSHNNWIEHHLTSDSLFSSVSGDGLDGLYTRPSFDDTDPHSKVIVRTTTTPGSEFLEISAASQHSNLGLTMDGDDVNIVYFQWNNPVINFTYTGVFHDPAIALAPTYGTYVPTGGTSSLTIYTTDFNLITFTTTSLAIGAVSAVPEPSTYTALAGLGALGFVIWKRRRLAAS